MLALLVAGCRSQESRIAYHVERGRAFLAKDKVDAAKIEFRAALSFDASNREANLELADLSEAEGHTRDARFYLREVLAHDPSHHEIALRLATLIRHDDPWRARQLLLKVISEDPENAFARLGLSQLELWMGRYDEAAASAHNAIEIDPGLPEAYWQLGMTYEAMIKRSTLDREPIDEKVRRKAIEAFDRFVETGGETEWKARIEQAQVLSSGSHNRLEALAAARRALESARKVEGEDQPKLIAAGHLASVARRQRDRAAYAEAIETLLEVTPRDFRSWRNLAELRAASGGSAEGVYGNLLTLFPYDPEAHILYSKHIGNTKGVWAAFRYFDEQIEAGIDPPHMLSALRSHQIAYRLTSQAEQTLERMQSDFPDNPWTQLELAKKSASDGYSLLAISMLEHVVEQEEIPEAYELLATLERFHKRPKRALRFSERAVETRGYYDSRLHNTLAQSRYEAGDYAGYLEAVATIAQRDELTSEQQLDKARALYITGDRKGGRTTLLELIDKVEQPNAATEATLEFVWREGDDPDEVVRARRLLLRALARDPENHDLLVARVELNLRVHRPDLALQILEGLAIESYPPSVRYLRSRLRADNDDVAGALEDIDLALRGDPLQPGVSDFALVLYARDEEPVRHVQKIQRWIRALRMSPPIDWLTNSRRIGQLHLVQSRLLHLMGSNEQAIAVLERAIENYEYAIDSRIDLAYLLTVSGNDLDRAIEIGNDIVRKQETNPRALDALGFAYLTAEKPYEALRNIRLAIRNNATPNARFHYHESLSLRDLGRSKEALEAIETVLTLDPDFPQADALRQTLQSGLGARDQAS
ncbi:MAG: hypothetical protein GY944_08780 [bacterium]|nr:hypothetical protein [bacterium]